MEARSHFNTDVLQRIFNLVKAADFVTQARLHRPGHLCSVPVLATFRTLLHGNCNVHVPIVWDDGEEWLARVRIKRFDEPPRLWNRIGLRSEYETIKHMHRAGLNVPNVFLAEDWVQGTTSLDYFFVARLPGRAWGDKLLLPPSQAANFIHDFAAFNVALSELHFPSVGSLHPPASLNEPPIVGPCTLFAMMKQDPPYFEGPIPTGPARHIRAIENALDVALDPLIPIPNVIAFYLMHMDMRRLLLDVGGLEEVGEETYITNRDDRFDRYLLDNEGHITGVIDWERSTTATKGEVFGGPRWMFDWNAFESHGDNRLSEWEIALLHEYEQLDRHDLAECVRNGRKLQRLKWMTGMEECVTMPQIIGLHEAFTGIRPMWMDEEEWKEEAIERYKGDVGLQTLLDREKAEKAEKGKAENLVQ